MAHIGVIRRLEELHIPIDYVVGTSMGSIIGGLYACGYTPDEMETLIKSIHWETLFQDAPDRKDQSFRQKEDDFDHLIPLEFLHEQKFGKTADTVEVTVKQLALPEKTTGSILTALAKGGGLSKWGLSSAITQIANDADDYELATDLERAGGKVLALDGKAWDTISKAA